MLLTFLVDVLLLPEVMRHVLSAARLMAIGMIAAEVAAPMLAVTAAGIVVGRLMEARQARAVRGAMLRVGACPTCAYSLRELEPDAEGVTTCAECGGAWVVPPAGEDGDGDGG